VGKCSKNTQWELVVGKAVRTGNRNRLYRQWELVIRKAVGTGNGNW
jgi:hypothetical protein